MTTGGSGHGAGAARGPTSTFTQRLEYLFLTIKRADGKQFTDRDVAEGITAQGTRISHTAIQHLRTGGTANPTLQTIRGLANFFGVPVGYFTDPVLADTVKTEIDLAAALAQLRDSDEARTIVVRTRGLSPNGLGAVLKVVNAIRELEGLPNPSGPPAERDP